MLFSSTIFLFVFLPVTVGGYYCLPAGGDLRWRNGWLLLASLFFYAWGEPTFVLMLLASVAWNYVGALCVASARQGVTRKLALTVCVAGNICFIGFYKYLNFATETLRAWFPSWCGVIPQTSIVLPIGISFFTFQALSYVIDVYRGQPVQRNPLRLALYIALFPQLVAGPIVRYSTIAEQLVCRSVDREKFTDGVMRFAIGFNKKMLLANPLSVVADYAFRCNGGSCLQAWLGAIAYTLQIYFDFSGYSDMAIGLGRLFGFEFLENFNYPYLARSFTEFWRRWHISLGSWFRDYVYFPLGGSRVASRWTLVRNLSVVWLLTGIWHGANWTFIGWGCLYGVLIMGEKLFSLPKHIESHKGLSWLYRPVVLAVIVMAWVVFRSPNVSSAARYVGTMWGMGAWWNPQAVFFLREGLLTLLIGIACALPVYPLLERWSKRRPVGQILLYGCPFVLFWISVSALVMEAHNPFIYFSF